MSTPKIEAKTPAGAAKKFHRWLQKWAEKNSYDPKRVLLWNPSRAKELGWGGSWMVAWEEGPYDWAMISAGSSLYAGWLGNYSKPAEIDITSGEGWYAEMQNHWSLCFWKS